ncbi:topless-related protein 4-like protein isoform X1 [Tanacetum coccineum]|uniref:Topless-related protein 4-like protein isoform X1 n=1 Tax=Tanacetum coccineum TaxID=301880 RepID=A0ABQ5J418_9ASTR
MNEGVCLSPGDNTVLHDNTVLQDNNVHSHRKVAAATAYGKFKDEITLIKGKAWLYDTIGSRVDYTAPGNSSTRMAYSADRTRLFSCGTNKYGDYYIVKWNESEGVVKHTYEGLKRSAEVVQFDTAKNWFLAASDECKLKVWDMDNIGLLKVFDVGGGLPVGAGMNPLEGAAMGLSLLECFAKAGSLLTMVPPSCNDAFENACMEFDEVNSKPPYRILWGIPEAALPANEATDTEGFEFSPGERA